MTPHSIVIQWSSISTIIIWAPLAHPTLVWPARPLPPLQIIILSFIVEGEGSSNSYSIPCAARYHPHTSVWPLWWSG